MIYSKKRCEFCRHDKTDTQEKGLRKFFNTAFDAIWCEVVERWVYTRGIDSNYIAYLGCASFDAKDEHWCKYTNCSDCRDSDTCPESRK